MTVENLSLSDHGYQLLLIATSQLVDDNREFDILVIFSLVLLLLGGRELMTIKDPKLIDHGYQLCPVTPKLMVSVKHSTEPFIW